MYIYYSILKLVILLYIFMWTLKSSKRGPSRGARSFWDAELRQVLRARDARGASHDDSRIEFLLRTPFLILFLDLFSLIFT